MGKAPRQNKHVYRGCSALFETRQGQKVCITKCDVEKTVKHNEIGSHLSEGNAAWAGSGQTHTHTQVNLVGVSVVHGA